MKATTKQQAERIAKAGAAKMTVQGYTYQASRFTPGTYCVNKPNEDGSHLVDLTAGFCSCVFFAENREFKACKHLSWMQDQHDWNESIKAREAEMEWAF